jgi:glycosyltransferase involved in cell wall biosynthesis
LLFYEPTRTACPGHFMKGRYDKCVQCVATSAGWMGSFMQLLLTFPRRMMCKMATVNTPITNHVLNRLQLSRSRLIYYGIPDPLPQNLPLVSISLTPVCFAYVGRLVAEKGLPLLVDAAARLRGRNYDFRLKFIGDGPERAKLEAMVAERGLVGKVTFTGFLSGDALREATQNVAAVVMPSIWEETAGLAAIEQMMCGRLVIASDIGGLGEVVDGAGLKAAAGDVESLVNCMKKVLDRPEMVDDIGRLARGRALKVFCQAGMVENHLGVYLDLVKGGV